jgi:hypothetical protein
MTLSVKDRGRSIATFRFVEVRLMEIVAAWTPTSPEMEVKAMFGRHLWDFAQHADALGKRTWELRLPEQHSLAPVTAYHALLEDVADVRGTGERLAALYDVLLPGLERRYRDYLERTDGLLDEPSVVIVERILQDLARHRTEAAVLARELGLARPGAEELRRRDAALLSVVPEEGVAP